MRGVTVGKGSVIGAGAVVTKDIPPYSIYVGVPVARIMPRFTEERINQHEQNLIASGTIPDVYWGSRVSNFPYGEVKERVKNGASR